MLLETLVAIALGGNSLPDTLQRSVPAIHVPADSTYARGSGRRVLMVPTADKTDSYTQSLIDWYRGKKSSK